MMRWLLSFITIILLEDIAVTTAYNPYKLPTSIKPYHYQLDLEPNIYTASPDDFVLNGRVEIDARVLNRTDNVTLHAVELALEKVEVLHNGKNLFKKKKYVRSKQWFVFQLKETLNEGSNIKIKITRYETPIQHSLRGLYYYSRKPPGKPRSYGVTTQLEATFARHMFPCYDEPAQKATFSISVLRKKPHFAISNMPVYRQVPDKKKGWVRDYFQRTPIMSTYLVAVIVTEYKGLSEMHRDVNFTIYYPEGKENSVQLAMRLSRKVFAHLEDYFDVRFPIPKLDAIGFKHKDYLFGGMENYGMITYKDPFLYTTPEQKEYKRYIAAVVLHEITHQWFGNLVTMSWWDDLWLNEGMTEFFSFLRGKWIAEYRPVHLGINHVMRAMMSEIRKDLPPVYVPWAKSPEDILSVINSVTYSKGGMIIRMAELIMGEDIFKEAMRSYVKRNKYGTVTHDHLWAAFTSTNKKHGVRLNMKKILSPWLKQPGYPVLNVSINHNAGKIHFEQSVFYKTAAEYDARMPEPSPFRYKWPLPLQWKTGNKGISEIVVKFQKSGTVSVPEKLYATDWLVVNPQAHFYYIVNYEKHYWLKLGKHLADDYLAFDEFTRGKIVFDVYNLYTATKSGKGNFIDANTTIAVLSFAQVETASLPRSLFKELFGGPLVDKKLKPIVDILKERKIISEDR